MAKPVLLLFNEGAEKMLGDALEDRFEFLRLWRAPDPAALLRERGGEVVAAFTWRLDAATLGALPGLKLIAAPGAGYDEIAVKEARARGVRVVNAGGVHSGDVADHALALTLAAVHRLPEAAAFARDGGWLDAPFPLRRRAMSRQKFGIVGLGNIGAAIAERLAPFGAEIAWWSPSAKPSRWPRRESLADLARWASALIVAVRGDATGLIDAATIDAVGPEGLIVNISRGAVIDEDALIAALKAGRLGQAALDVFAEEPTPPARWRDAPNVLLTPHIAGVSDASLAKLRAAAIQNLTSVLDGTAPVNEISE